MLRLSLFELTIKNNSIQKLNNKMTFYMKTDFKNLTYLNQSRPFSFWKRRYQGLPVIPQYLYTTTFFHICMYR